MGIVKVDDFDPMATTSRGYDLNLQKDIGFIDTLDATLRTENPVAGAAIAVGQWAAAPMPDDNYDAFEDMQGYEQYAPHLSNVQSKVEMMQRKGLIDKELEAKRTIASSGTMANLAAGIMSGAVDPFSYIPVGGEAYQTYRRGGRILEGAARTAMAGAASSIADEVVLHGVQDTRTMDDSYSNVAAATFLSGALGGAAAGLSPNEFHGLAKRVDEDLHVEPNPREANPFESTAGAMQAPRTTMEQETLKSAFGLEKALQFNDPVLRLANSPSLEVLRVNENLAETALLKNKNTEGIASAISVENSIKGYNVLKYMAYQDVDNLFAKYRGRVKANGEGKGGVASQMMISAGDLVGKARRDGKFTRHEFGEEVTKALRQNDTHPVAEVQAAAQSIRKNILEPIKREGIKAGIFGEDMAVKTATSYAPRVWDKLKVMSQPNEFKRINRQWMIEKRDQAVARMGDMEHAVDVAKVMLGNFKKELNMGLTDAGRAKTKIRDQGIALSKEHSDAKRALSFAETDFNRAHTRAQEFKPTPLEDKQFWRKLLNDVRRGKTTDKTTSLIDFIKSKGGVMDNEGHDLKTMFEGEGGKGIVNNKSGRKSLDAIGEIAHEAGYFKERPTYTELLQAMEHDFRSGGTHVHERDLDTLAHNDYLVNLEAELSDRGHNVHEMTPEQLAVAMDAFPNDHYVADKPVTRARYREIEYNKRRAGERLEQMEKRVTDIEEKLIRHVDEKMKMAESRSELAGITNERRKAVKSAIDILEKSKEDFENNKWRAGQMDGEIDDVVDLLMERIKRTPAGRLDYDMKLDEDAFAKSRGKAGLRGSAKGRVYDIPDARVESYLVNDLDTVVDHYVHSLVPDIELVKKFGSVDLTDQIQKVREEYARMKSGKTDKEVMALNKRMNDDIRDMTAISERLRGTYKQTDDYASPIKAAGRIGMAWNYVTKLGGMTVSAFADVGRPVMRHGLGRTFKDGLLPLVTNLRAFRLAAEEVKLSSTALDMALETRARALAGMDEYAPITNRIEGALHNSAKTFGVVSLMSQWNATWKQISGVIVQHRILDVAANYAKAGRSDIEKLAENFVDREMAERIHNQFLKYGENRGGTKIANATLWDDAVARDTFRAGVRRDVDITIVTPGQDKPLWISTEQGRLLGQFKSFGLASVQRVLLSGLQQRDMAVLNGTILSVGLGILSYRTKAQLAGREASDDWRVNLTEGIDKSGILGWFFDANNIAEKVSRGRIGVNALIGGPPMSRYASRSALEAMFGPTYGTIGDVVGVTGNALAGDWSAADTHALRQLTPYQNLFYMKGIFDDAEHGVNDALGVENKDDK